MTRLLVLGMLDIQPMSGYDIQQALKMTDAERWGGVLIGSIYHALKKMDQEGYVAVTSIEQTGHRQKAIYTITKAGKEHLQILIREALQVPSITYPTNLYSGLSFYEKLSQEECRNALEQQHDTLKVEYEAVVDGLERKKEAMNDQLPPMVMLMMDHMISMIKQQQEFIVKALEILNSKE